MSSSVIKLSSSSRFTQLLQPQRPVHFSSAFTQAHRLVEQPDLHRQFTFSRTPYGATGIVIHLTDTWPSLISQPNSQGHIIAWRPHFQIYAWYEEQLVCNESTSFVQGIVVSEYCLTLNRLNRAILTSSSHNCSYKTQTYFWMHRNSSCLTVQVDPSDLKADMNSGYFSSVFIVLVFHLTIKSTSAITG